MNPNPECELECMFQVGMGMTTCAYYPPVYDKYGNNINPDRNVTSGELFCYTCGKKWTYAIQLGKTEYKELGEL